MVLGTLQKLYSVFIDQIGWLRRKFHLYHGGKHLGGRKPSRAQGPLTMLKYNMRKSQQELDLNLQPAHYATGVLTHPPMMALQ